ncbi:MAG: DUF4143 domain-containing protein [Actinobacteria bacterium]|nr:DUF4143 domain-containing protein [Actinomycetota bacterium]
MAIVDIARRSFSLASRLQIPASTLKRYLDLLELLFMVRRIPAWSTTLTPGS